MDRTAPYLLISLKKYCYFIFLIPLSVPYIAIGLNQFLNLPNFLAYLPLMVVFIGIPIADYIIGHDPYNPELERLEYLSKQNYFKFILLAVVPLQYFTTFFGAYCIVNTDFNLIGSIGWILSIGILSGSLGITVAHELIHKNSRIEKLAGGMLLAGVCYGSFKIEHIRGHHVWVGTERDVSTARINDSVYTYLRKVIPHNFILGWKLQNEVLAKNGKRFFSLSNELLGWYTLSFAFFLGFVLLFNIYAGLFFILQSFAAICTLETINYVEHYGLVRKQHPDGTYEKVNANHSWTTDFLVTNLILFQLQRHSDHHIQAKRPYQALLHHKQSPSLPGGYASMIVLALIPPLWFKIINPRIPQN